MTTYNRYCLLLLLCGAVAGAPPRSHELTDSYAFRDYIADFDRTYEEGTNEFELRKGVFDDNLATILEHNRRYYGDEEDDSPSFTMGINHYTDQRPEELHFGYKTGPHRLSLDNDNDGADTEAVARQLGASALPFTNDPVSELPSHVDWRENDVAVVTPPKNQGSCGSCWAFATTEVMESHIAIKTGKLIKLSPQDLVNCVKNPEKCGGAGGCEGATYELGFDYIKKHGLKKENELPYTGRDGVCSIRKGLTLRGRHHNKFHIKAATGTASITGYANVPTNDYVTTMNAVAKTGPVAIALDASNFSSYEGGVFHANGWSLNHAVVLVGYGTDEETGKDYWLVRNSWGADWGESGYIRIKREGESHCGYDKEPLEGVACALDADGNKTNPEKVKVCGMVGILFDVAFPLGGHLKD